ncbi:flavin reductase [Streptomyces sp. NPDC088725]|uniref:flavin reductase family protein n=1 Tax=Streptomyces sp. NPDC088725 TaxID=3365873 RepID=UPI00381C5E3A
MHPTDAHHSDVRPADVRSTDVRPADVRPADVRPADVRSTDAHDTRADPTDVRPTAAHHTDAPPPDAHRSNSAPLRSTGPSLISGALFRQAMASVATPVSVVTTTEGNTPYGTTVSAFASLSMDPPMALIALDRSSSLLKVLRRTHRFGLNVLSAGQDSLAGAFARKGADKFAGINWQQEAGLPRLAGVSVWLACTVDHFLPGGDHLIAAGRVNHAHVNAEAAPLTYHRNQFGTHITQ